MANILVTIPCLLVLLAFTEGQHKHVHSPGKGKEEYSIVFKTNEPKSQSWVIQKNHRVVKQINDYVKINPSKTLPKGTGYLGYLVQHKVGGVLMHTWEIPKCDSPSLERNLLQAAPAAIRNLIQSTLETALKTCPTTV